MNSINKVGKIIADGLLVILIGGVLVLPVSFVGLAGVEQQQTEVLSAQDVEPQPIRGELVHVETPETSATHGTDLDEPPIVTTDN